MTMEARAGLEVRDRLLKSERLEPAQLSFGEGQALQRAVCERSVSLSESMGEAARAVAGGRRTVDQHCAVVSFVSLLAAGVVE